MAALSPQTSALAGITPTFNTAAAGGDTFVNDGKTWVHIKNDSGGSITVTFNCQPTSFDDTTMGTVSLSDTAVAVGAGAEAIVGPFPPARFNDSTGAVNISYSAVTSLTVAVVSIGKTFV